jgi:uncharacterized membrane protein YraQ (UPF0718 family)
LKIHIDIVIGSAANALINTMVRSVKLADQEIMVLQRGTADAELDGLQDVHIREYSDEALSIEYLTGLMTDGTFGRLIIEHDGNDLPRLFDALENPEIRKACKIHKVFLAVDCSGVMLQKAHEDESFDEMLEECDVVVKYGTSSKDGLSPLNALLKSKNPRAKIIDAESHDAGILDAQLIVKKKSAFEILLIPFILLIAAYLAYQLCRAFLPQQPDFAPLQNLVTVFLSILYEAFPFILIGIFVSSFIQVLVSPTLLERIFTRNKVVGYIAALFAGVIFPVCDCATVPVVARLIKKGVPVPIAITFFLAAPIVNPIVIASTLYAFPGHPIVAIYRVVFGLLIALITGMIFQGLPLLSSAETITIDRGADETGCCCEHHRSHEESSRFQVVLKHAAAEFFEVGVYLIIGALISSIIQTFVPKSAMIGLGGSIVLSTLSMMMAAFIMSICSTSDAFIARSFANALPMSSVMGFLLLGPMIDLKNLLLLMGSFRKPFVLKLVVTVVLVAFSILLIFTISF